VTSMLRQLFHAQELALVVALLSVSLIIP